MKFLFTHPTKGLCVANEDGSYITLTDAYSQFPEIADKLVSDGDIREVILKGNYWLAATEVVASFIEVPVPEECRGESCAFTSEEVDLQCVQGDGYCIENNWELRGDYWIIDCLPKNTRLIHSDAKSYNKEFEISQCLNSQQ